MRPIHQSYKWAPPQPSGHRITPRVSKPLRLSTTVSRVLQGEWSIRPRWLTERTWLEWNFSWLQLPLSKLSLCRCILATSVRVHEERDTQCIVVNRLPKWFLAYRSKQSQNVRWISLMNMRKRGASELVHIQLLLQVKIARLPRSVD